ncbi:MAG: tetraacyldisaccharide 4'-kinase [Planctomycetia bacterium]|nr:tetraacyldisaccharide 4'-kinase [Planctomycetia bacterium]
MNFYQTLIQGRKKGVIRFFLRSLLWMISLIYSLIMRIRNGLYDKNIFRNEKISVPVISVGNITLGGTGKTPMVAWLLNFYQERKENPALISRGYHAREISKANQDHSPFSDSISEGNDEARELALRLPGLIHYSGADRVSVAHHLINDHPDTSLLILDDAFQHRRIHRDLDLVLLDALNPFGYGHIFPRGLLREPLRALQRADAVLLSRADLASEEQKSEIRKKAEKSGCNPLWCEVAHTFSRVFSGEIPVASFEKWKKEKKGNFIAFCGLGNPEGFRLALEKQGINLAHFIPFSDHHVYTKEDFDLLLDRKKRSDAVGFLTTMKDLVKIGKKELGQTPLWGLETEMIFLKGEKELKDLLLSLNH